MKMYQIISMGDTHEIAYRKMRHQERKCATITKKIKQLREKLKVEREILTYLKSCAK